jgi:hypothetical protein
MESLYVFKRKLFRSTGHAITFETACISVETLFASYESFDTALNGASLLYYIPSQFSIRILNTWMNSRSTFFAEF